MSPRTTQANDTTRTERTGASTRTSTDQPAASVRKAPAHALATAKPAARRRRESMLNGPIGCPCCPVEPASATKTGAAGRMARGGLRPSQRLQQWLDKARGR